MWYTIQHRIVPTILLLILHTIGEKGSSVSRTNSYLSDNAVQRILTTQLVLCCNHHHHQSELVSDVAVSVSVRQVVLFCALRSPDAKPRLNWRRSSSTVLSQVCLGRPGRRLQFLGAGDMQACRAREWSWDLSARAMWPNNFRRLVRTVSDSSGCPVRLWTSKSVTYDPSR